MDSINNGTSYDVINACHYANLIPHVGYSPSTDSRPGVVLINRVTDDVK